MVQKYKVMWDCVTSSKYTLTEGISMFIKLPKQVCWPLLTLIALANNVYDFCRFQGEFIRLLGNVLLYTLYLWAVWTHAQTKVQYQ